MNDITLCIAGSREFRNYKLFKLIFETYIRPVIERDFGPIACIIDGDCPTGGVDAMANRYAIEKGIKWARYPADWKNLGKKAGPIRNGLMADSEASVLWCYHISGRGSMDVMQQFRQRDKHVIETRV